MLSLIPKNKAIKLYAAAWIAAYLILVFALRSHLPDKYLRDSLTIQSLADSAQTAADWRGAYSLAAKMAGIFPLWALNILVATVGSATIWTVITSLRSMRGMVLVIPALAPAIILNMVQFGKETFVIPLTFLIWHLTKKLSSKAKALLAIALIYFIYGIFFREYYLLILAAFCGILLFRRSAPPLRLMYLLLLMVLACVTPTQVFEQLQGSRDQINHLSNMITNEVRTAIYNPFTPDNAFHFLLNYLYAVARLNVPLAFEQTSNEIILTINLLIYFYLVAIGLRQRSVNPATYLPWLFIAHILVLTIFEPDEGSYFRHFSSAIIYLIPTLRLVEDRYASRLQKHTMT